MYIPLENTTNDEKYENINHMWYRTVSRRVILAEEDYSLLD